MASYIELSAVALTVGEALETLRAKRAALAELDPAVTAAITADQATLDTAIATFETARAAARDATGWTAANDELTAAQTAYTDAKAAWDTFVQTLDPLE